MALPLLFNEKDDIEGAARLRIMQYFSRKSTGAEAWKICEDSTANSWGRQISKGSK
jgi:hypothetical protein